LIDPGDSMVLGRPSVADKCEIGAVEYSRLLKLFALFFREIVSSLAPPSLIAYMTI